MLVLASSSPRRSMLLDEWGYTFEIIMASVDEELPEEISPERAVRELAMKKALAGLNKRLEAGGSEDDVILGADTVVVLDGRILGKPSGPQEARAMLEGLSGRNHEVWTGVALVSPSSGSETTGICTMVNFRELLPGEIESYVLTGEPLDKAGAYGIQGGAAKFVSSVDGSYTNVIGLPMEYLSERLAVWGIYPVDTELNEVEHESLSPKGLT
ncbi:MAG: Maf family protein [Desulfitobacterium hafniense]|nr:Maf family protein [Desulfitobacterium hafniense]